MHEKYLNFLKKYFLLFSLLLLSTLFTLSSIFWTKQIVYTDQKDLRDVRVGFPFRFVSTDFIDGNDITIPNLYILPQKMGFNYQFQNRIIWHLFLLNILIVQFVLSIILLTVSKWWGRRV